MKQFSFRRLRLQVVLLLLVFFAANSLIAHPIYVSLCDISYSEDAASVKITLMLFTEDLEMAIQQKKGQALYLGREEQIETADIEVYNYLKEQFSIKLNLIPLVLDSLQKEISIGKTRTTCVFDNISLEELKEITVSHLSFFELFEEQRNLVRIKTAASKKNMLLTKQNPSDTIFY